MVPKVALETIACLLQYANRCRIPLVDGRLQSDQLEARKGVVGHRFDRERRKSAPPHRLAEPVADLRGHPMYVGKKFKPDSADRFGLEFDRKVVRRAGSCSTLAEPCLRVRRCVRVRKSISEIR